MAQARLGKWGNNLAVRFPGDMGRAVRPGLAVVCPITSKVRPFPTSVVLPPGLPAAGEILTSHFRGTDTLARPIRYAGAARGRAAGAGPSVQFRDDMRCQWRRVNPRASRWADRPNCAG